jgi:hypothetical protein
LLDAQGRLVSTSEAKFAIAVAQDMGVGARISTDKTQYAPSDSVALLDRISNKASNSVLEDLKARTSVRSEQGVLLWESTQPLAQLVGGALKELNYRLPLGNAQAGRYQATVTVLNVADEVLASSAATFDVQSTATTGAGLGGSLQVVGSPVPAGESAAFTWSMSNKGNADLSGLPVTVRLVDPALDQEIARLDGGVVGLNAGQSYNRSQSWTATDNLIDHTLVAVLTTQVGGRSVDLARATFTVTKPPIKLDLTQVAKAGFGGGSRVLVLYDCEPDLGWDLLSWLRLFYTHSCYKERKDYLSNYLTTLKVPYYITYDRTAFRKELRSGSYNTIWMLGGLPDCTGALLNEVREAVNRGATLLVDGGSTAYQNHDLFRMAGARYGGHIWLSTKAMDVGAGLYTPTRLSTAGLPLRLTRSGGTVQASYAQNYCYRVDYDGDDKSAQPSGTAYPAVISNGYGRGKAVAFGFDLINALRNGGADATKWQRFVNETLGYLTPAGEARALVPGEYAALGTQMVNQGTGADVQARMSMPAAATIVGTTPQATLETGNKALWKFNLAAGATQALQLTMRAPLTAGSYDVGTDVSVMRNNQLQPYGSYKQTFAVMDNLTPAKQAQTRLKNLSVSLLEALTLLNAQVNIDYGLSLYQQGRWGDAVEELTEAANSVRQLSVDLSVERLAIDRLIQEAQYRWYLTQPK